MGVETEIVVLDLIGTEATGPEGVLSRFAAVAAESDITTVRRWSPGSETYVVVHDPGLRVIGAVRNAPGVRIKRAASLDFPTEKTVQLSVLQSLLPVRLGSPISFPPGTEPQASIPRPSGPLVFCPNCDVRIHPPPVCDG